jgi:ABC-type lipoprotein release transport system permease subunit
MNRDDKTLPRAGSRLLALVHLRLLRSRPEMDVLGLILLVVVSCICGFGLVLHRSVKSVFERSGDAATVLVLARGSNGEAESFIDSRDATQLKALLSEQGLTGLRYDEQMVMSASSSTNGAAARFLTFRGVQLAAGGETVRSALDLLEGRIPDPRFNEVLVGRAMQKNFPEFTTGASVELAQRTWIVSGVFGMGGDVRENEVFGDLQRVQEAYAAYGTVNSIRISAIDLAQAERIVSLIKAADDLELVAWPEDVFFEERAEPVAEAVARLQWLVMALLIPTSFLGMLSIQRVQQANMLGELRMLNFIGFQPQKIRLSLLLRAVLVGLVASFCTCLILGLGVVGRSAEFDVGLQLLDVGFTAEPWMYWAIVGAACLLAALAGGLTNVERELD